MEEIQLSDELEQGVTYFENKVIKCASKLLIADETIILSFKNCVFENRTYFQNKNNDSKLQIFFTHCLFKKLIKFDFNTLSVIQFSNIKEIVSITIRGNKIKSLNFEYTTLEKGSLRINVKNINDINFLDFSFQNIEIRSTKEFRTNLYIENFIIKKLFIHNTYIIPISLNSFSNLIINNMLIFNNCKFDSVNFDKSKIKYGLTFNECEFNSLMSYKDCVESFKIILSITNCTFKKSSYFDNSIFQSINIRDTIFEEKVSFDSVKTNAVNLSQIIFLGNAYFDNFKILNPFKNTFSITEKKRTYRTIKQELQKLENRIDYNIFRVYELTMHKLEVKELLQDSKVSKNERSSLIKDKCILFLHQYASNFGTDWKKALTFVLCSGFTFYTILFMVENSNKEFDIYGFHNYIKGFFNYIMVTNFDNPLDNKDELKFNYIPSYFIFIIGKIFIAFGIYEMIQSFRKFRY